VVVGDFLDANTLVYSDLLSGRMYAAILDSNRQVSTVTQFNNEASYIVDVKLGPDGYLYGASLFGPSEIVRWVPT
jgi:hypothetical protein